jgi:hypothetical protein
VESEYPVEHILSFEQWCSAMLKREEDKKQMTFLSELFPSRVRAVEI